MYFRSSLVRFFSDTRNVSSKRTQHDNSRAPSLHGRYSASSLLWTPPTPDQPAHRVMDSPAASGLRTPVDRVSQVPRPFLRYAPSATTPMGRPAAPAGCFTGHAGFITLDRLATHNLRFEAEPGSTLRLTAHSFAVQRSPAFARAFYPDRPRFPCLVTSARQAAATYLTSNYMATSFQIAGKARLNLTHLKTLKKTGLRRAVF